jgi:hypothetical protein
MPKYIIERNIPGAGALDRQQLAAITQTSCNVLRGWVRRFNGLSRT